MKKSIALRCIYYLSYYQVLNFVNRLERHNFVVPEKLYRTGRIRKMSRFNFPNQNLPKDEKRCKAWTVLNDFLYG